MIKLKSGIEITYTENIDEFLQNIVHAVIRESFAKTDSTKSLADDTILKDVMDNCIYITHQLFEIAKEKEELAKLLTTGFLFNHVVHIMKTMGETIDSGSITKKDQIH